MTKVNPLKPGSGFFSVELGAGGKGLSASAFAQGEVGAKLTPSIDLFAFGKISESFREPGTPDWATGVGLKGTF